jgi:hypothetical protein
VSLLPVLYNATQAVNSMAAALVSYTRYVPEGKPKTFILFNAGIKSLSAAVPDEIFTGDFAS